MGMGMIVAPECCTKRVDTCIASQVSCAVRPGLQLNQGLVSGQLLGQHQRHLLPDHLRGAAQLSQTQARSPFLLRASVVGVSAGWLVQQHDDCLHKAVEGSTAAAALNSRCGPAETAQP